MIKFYGLLDFYPKRKKIKEEYDKLTLDEIIAYKKIVYSICFEREYIKDLIWEYLNDWYESQFKLSKEYREKKAKNDRRYKYMRLELNEDTNTFKII